MKFSEKDGFETIVNKAQKRESRFRWLALAVLCAAAILAAIIVIESRYASQEKELARYEATIAQTRIERTQRQDISDSLALVVHALQQEVESLNKERDSLGNLVTKLKKKKKGTGTSKPKPSPTPNKPDNLELSLEVQSKNAKPPVVSDQIYEQVHSRLTQKGQLKSTIYMQFRQEKDKKIGSSIKESLKKEGYFVPPMESIEFEFESGVRYFNEADSTEAKKISEFIIATLKKDSVKIDMKLFEPKLHHLNAQRKQIEVWLNLQPTKAPISLPFSKG